MAPERNLVLLSHPHVAAVATGAAQGLAARGLLWRYITGIVAARGSRRGALVDAVARFRPAAANRLVDGIDGTHLRSLGAVELGARAIAKVGPWLGVRGPSAYDALFVAHDAATAVLRWPSELRAAFAYEDGALRTFQKARRCELARVWDLPAAHYETIARIWQEESARWPGAMGGVAPREPAWKRDRKDRELALASAVSVASRFTRASLERIDVRKPIVVTPYGFPLEEFRAKGAPPAGPFTVLSVGTHDLRKGTPYLLEAWRRAGLKDACLRLVGAMRLTPQFLTPYAGTFEHVPHRAKRDLWRDYHAADLLAFPTLGDGFGLVIQEAMCCATPVLTTRCGGGPECLTDGVEGWIVPERDIDALVEKLRFASANRDALATMGKAARARAARWTWADAGLALADAVAKLISSELT